MTPRSEASQTKSQWLAGILITCLIALSACARHPHERRTGALLEDKITTERVETALHSAGKNEFSNVQVITSNGVVTLSGAVASPTEKTRATEIAKSVERVKEIRNRLEINPTTSRSSGRTE